MWELEAAGKRACQIAAPIDMPSSANLTGFTDAVRRALTTALMKGAPAESNGDRVREMMWPASVCATGLVDRAVVRVPMGWDDAAQAPRWATFELIGQQMILLGTIEPGQGADPTTASLRLHAVWPSGTNADRLSAEVVELSGLRVGSAATLSKAINDEAATGAEVRLSWSLSR
jgi:hypothetical protein